MTLNITVNTLDPKLIHNLLLATMVGGNIAKNISWDPILGTLKIKKHLFS